MGKNTNKPVRAPPPPSGGEADFEEKPFHSKEYENNYLDSLLNAKERPTWDEFKEIQRKKAEMDGDGANEEAQRRFRKELDEVRYRVAGGWRQRWRGAPSGCRGCHNGSGICHLIARTDRAATIHPQNPPQLEYAAW